MSDYRVVCTEQTHHSTSGHIVSVGTGAAGSTADSYQYSWTVAQVWSAMDRGDRFWTAGGGKPAWVEKFRCACGSGSLRSSSDATTLNNLDSLTLCSLRRSA